MIRVKLFIKYSVLFIGLFFLINNGSYASKFMASDFGWQKVGQDSFLVTLTIYKDCNGAALGTAKIYFKCIATNSITDSLLISAPTGTDVTPVCSSTQTRCKSSTSTFPYGISRYIYQGIIYLNNAGSCCSIRMYYADSNRNSNITTGAASKPFYTEAIFNRCISPADHAPTFSNLPVEILCKGQDHSFNPGIIDNDKDSSGNLDSMLYEWAVPLKSFNDTITYTGSYSYDKPIYFWGFPNAALPFPRGIHLDPWSGDIQFRPMKDEVTVMAIKVKEYRKGTYIGEVRRDIQTIVMTCTNNNPPLIYAPSGWPRKNCPGIPISKTFSTSDPNTNDTVTISWNHGIPGATLTTTNGQSKHPTATFSWTPTDSDVSTTPYTFTITARDNACPISATYTQAYQYTIQPNPKASISVVDSGCGLYYFNAQLISGVGPIYSWLGQNFTFNPKIGNTVYHRFNKGTYPYSMTIVASGCATTYYDTIVADSFLSIELPPDTFVCEGSQVNIASKIYYSGGPVKYVWNSSPADTLASKTITVTRDTLLVLTATDTSGCSSKDSIYIKLFNTKASVTQDTSICLNNSATLKVTGGKSWLWSTGDTSRSILVNPAQSTTYHVWITDSNCVFNDSVRLSIFPLMSLKITPDTIICPGQSVRLEVSGGKKYLWNTGDTLPVIVKSPAVPLFYSVRVTDQFNCIAWDWVYVDIKPFASVFAGNDSFLCLPKGQLYLLTGTPSSGNIFWTGKGVYQDSTKNWYFDPYGTGINHLGKYPVYIHYSNPNSCWNTDTAVLTVSHNLSIDAGQNLLVCIKSNQVELKGTPAGGTWQGIGTSQNKYFDPKTAGTGIHRLYYFLAAPCPTTDSVLIEVIPLPNVTASTISGKTLFCSSEGLVKLIGLPAGGYWTGKVDTGNYFNSTNPDGSYSLVYHYSDSFSCSGVDTLILTIAIPKIQITSNKDFVCDGEILYLTAKYELADSILWTKGKDASGIFNGNIYHKNISYIPGNQDYNTGSFWIWAQTFSSVCPSVMDTIFIKAGYYPVADFTANPLAGPVPLRVDFTNNSNIIKGKIDSYLWIFGDGNSSELFSLPHTYDEAGSFDVKLIAISEVGCIDTLIRRNYINSTNGIQFITIRKILKFYPNPAHNELFIENPANESVLFTMTDVFGKTLLAKTIIPGKSTIPIQSIKPGLYFIFMDGMSAGKLLIE